MMMHDSLPFEEAYRDHEERLQSFCFRLIGDREAARDITQDVFLVAHQTGQFEAPWLFACARHRCTDHLRRRGVWRRLRESVARAVPWPKRFEDEIVDRDLGWSVLRRMPEKARSLLLLRAYAGLSYEELAEVLQTTPEAVGVMLHRARRRAALMMSKEVTP